MEAVGFSSEGEGLHALEFVNSFGFWCERGELAEFFLCLPEQLLSHCKLEKPSMPRYETESVVIWVRGI